ncbi:MAG: DUF1275 family protein [Candidatus Devosia symbiotica]|nr:DUF1275 family protein [Candidatus Devosia symbiotica]
MTPIPQLSLDLLLTPAAGFAHVIGFIELDGHYTSFMSGNTTQLGHALAQNNWSIALLTSSLLLIFNHGQLFRLTTGPTGQRTLGFRRHYRHGAGSYTLTIGLALLSHQPTKFMLALADGVGAQNAILPSTG